VVLYQNGQSEAEKKKISAQSLEAQSNSPSFLPTGLETILPSQCDICKGVIPVSFEVTIVSKKYQTISVQSNQFN
jgi:hypothetical protein